MGRAIRLSAAALLLAGCSFIQSWGDLRDGEGMDAGATSDGGADAGFDADTDCNDCDLEGCGMGSPDCQFVPAPIDCFVCLSPGVEGDACDDDGECQAGLICEMGFCLFDCAGGDCGASAIGDYCGAPDTDRMRRVCVDDDRDCNPFSSTCGDEQPCVIVPDPDAPGTDVGTFCARSDRSIPPLQPCTPIGPMNFDERCTDGYTCVPDPPPGTGAFCREVCSVPNPSCTGPAEMCVPILGPGGETFAYRGERIGVCRPEMVECTDEGACEGGPNGEFCVGGLCGRCDPTRPTCPPDQECVDPDADGRFDCQALFECNAASECTTVGGAPLCINSLCFARCVSDNDCVGPGLRRCITYQGMQVCVTDCNADGRCNNGTTCASYDRVPPDDCRLP